MRKVTLVGSALLCALLCLALVARVSASSERWSDNFNEFVPLAKEATETFDDWIQQRNSTQTANCTFAWACLDGVLQITVHDLITNTPSQYLTLTRNITYDGSATIHIRFSTGGCPSIVFTLLRDLAATYTHSILGFYAMNNQLYLKWWNTSTLLQDCTTVPAVDPSLWYDVYVYWESAPNSFNCVVYEEDTDDPVINQTITNHLYDLSVVNYWYIDIAGKGTANLGRLQLDYIKNTAGSGGSGLDIAGLMAIVLPIACIGLLMNKIGDWT